MKKLKSFLVSAGDSSQGPIGFCVRVKAHDKAEAIQKVKENMPEYIPNVHKDFDMPSDIEYFNVYFNEDAITVADISDGETEDAREMVKE